MGINSTRRWLAAALTASVVVLPQAQERKVPEDSARISIAGCARGRTFIVGVAADHEPTNNSVQPGQRFHLSGKKNLMKEIEKHGPRMVEVTGLVRKADLAGPGGIGLAGGRVRIGGGPMRDPMSGGDVSRQPGVNQAFLDLEAWRQLPDPCPAK